MRLKKMKFRERFNENGLELREAKKHDIEIAVDTDEAEDFKKYLINQGHTAKISKSTGNYVDGKSTSSDKEANKIMNDLWNKYSKS